MAAESSESIDNNGHLDPQAMDEICRDAISKIIVKDSKFDIEKVPIWNKQLAVS